MFEFNKDLTNYNQDYYDAIISSSSTAAADKALALLARGNLKAHQKYYASGIEDYNLALRSYALPYQAHITALIHRGQARMLKGEYDTARQDFIMVMTSREIHPEYYRAASRGFDNVNMIQKNLTEIKKLCRSIPRSRAVLYITNNPVFSPRINYRINKQAYKRVSYNISRISLDLKEDIAKKQDKPFDSIPCFP